MNEFQWGDWRERKAAMIGQEICSINGGRWPVTLEEWNAAAARYGLKLFILEGISPSALRLDNVIVVRRVSKPDVLHRRICHEIAEAITQRDGRIPPFAYQSSIDESHNVARMVEKYVNPRP